MDSGKLLALWLFLAFLLGMMYLGASVPMPHRISFYERVDSGPLPAPEGK